MAKTKEVIKDFKELKSVAEGIVTEAGNAAQPANEGKYFKKVKKGPDGFPLSASNYPKHYVAIALLLKNNAEIRRFTALGILNYLLQKQEISGDKRYVSFKWNKFAVKANGLVREYSYNESFFLNALIAAFSSFSASAQKTINVFCHKEMSCGVEKAIDTEEVNEIISLNEQYSASASDVVEE